MEKVKDGSLLKGLASRTVTLVDRPLGMPGDSDEGIWVEYLRGVKTTWRICFTVKPFTLLQHLQGQGDWLEFRQALVTSTRVGLERSLLLGDGSFRAPVSKIVVEALRLLSSTDDSETFAANVSLESAGEPSSSEVAVRKAMLSRNQKADFATAVTGFLSQMQKGAAVSDVAVVQELPSEVELRGGMREQLFVAAVPNCSRASNHGICEGFELVAVVSASCQEGAALQALRSDQVLSKLSSHASESCQSCRLCFRSPFAKLPRFSSKQLSDRLGSSAASAQSAQGFWDLPCACLCVRRGFSKIREILGSSKEGTRQIGAQLLST